MQILQRIVTYLLTLFLTLTGVTPGFSGTAADFPRASVEAKTLLLTDVPSDGSALTLAAMQGLLADVSDKNLVFRAGKYREWIPRTGAEALETQPDGSPWDLAALLHEFAPFFDGYILCDEESAAVALTLANPKNSVPVYPEFEETAKAAGLSMTLDVRGWTDVKLRATEEFRALRRDIAFEQPASFSPKLVDYAVMCGAYVWYDKDANQAEHTNAFRFLSDGAVVFGWNNDIGEYKTVQSFSRLNVCMVPADHAHNLSVLSGFDLGPFEQKTESAAEEGGRTVCLMMSDGDNLQWFLGSYDDTSHYGSPIRGEFSFAWGVPASAADLASPVLKGYYDQMTPNDAFVLSLSGLGYTFPSKWPNRVALKRMAQTLGKKMEAMDVHELLVLDDGGFSSLALNTLLKGTNADGIFYIDYSDYARLHGKTRFVNGKPIVSARYRLWNNASGASPEEIAAAVNALPTDPKNPDSYAFIIVHAWTGLSVDGELVEGGSAMRAVKKLVDLLDADTRVVTPAEFISRLAENCG
ncbi:MAG: hypothetical protein IK104_07365 [Clostridia bacterium]|nr:hypothetical protein [Clostridia bacterium]